MSNYIERYWRDATPEDAIKEPPMVARFRIDNDDTWQIETLQGIDRATDFPWRGLSGGGKQCQVYDAPDPGEGYRLIDPDKDKPQVGDEIYERKDRWLNRSHERPYEKELVYRRRIEQPKPEPRYVPFRWEDREQLRGRWLQRKTDSVPGELLVTKFETGRRGLVVNGIYGADLLLKQWTFLDTGEPVGKKVV